MVKRSRGEYRALFVADVHMSNKLAYARPSADGRTDRLDDQLALWKRVHATAEEEGCAAIYVLGDLFDKSLVDAVTLTHTVQAVVGEASVPVYLLPGNHDANTIRGGRFTVEAFNHMGRPGVACLNETAGYHAKSWLRFWPVKFMTANEVRQELADIRTLMGESRCGVEVLLLHQSVVGCSHFGWVCDDGLGAEEVCEGFDWVLAGHFHDSQYFGPDNRGRYLGAPMHHRFDDEDRLAPYWVITFREDGKLKAEPRDGGAPKFHTIRWGKGDEMRVAPGDYLRVVVEATHAEFNRVKPDVLAFVEEQKAAGIRAHHKHKPVYHHTARIKGRDKSAALTTEQAVEAYPDAVDVDVSGLDLKLLKRIGREVLEAARAES
jgi:DNA repair exonuclease SbcCD nuclease subunit